MKDKPPVDRRLLIIIMSFILYELTRPGFTRVSEEPCSELRYLDSRLTIVECGSEVNSKVESVPADLTPFFFQKIPINTASKDTLESINGIGPSLSEKIIAFRNKKGGITNVGEFCRIDGIGLLRSEQLSKQLSFEE